MIKVFPGEITSRIQIVLAIFSGIIYHLTRGYCTLSVHIGVVCHSVFPEGLRVFFTLSVDGVLAMLQELAVQVLELYRDVDRAVAGFASRTELSCPAGCGHCCSSVKVEATVLECLPLAFELFRTLQAELILKRLEINRDERRCILYRADYTESGLWGCTQYPYRAIVCRLFGFAGNPDREGNARLAMCRVMKDNNQQVAAGLDDADFPMPLFVDAGMRITSLHPGMGVRRLPINEALREALMKVGMLLDLTTPKQLSTPEDPEHPSNNPVLPSNPRGRKAA